MAQGHHTADTAWIVIEPDMCMYKIDAAARTELVAGRMSAQQFERYEDFGAEIQDVAAKRVFYEHLETWRALKVEHGVAHVPWPRDANSPPDPKSMPMPPWRKKDSFKAPEPVPVLPKVKKVEHGKTTVERISPELLDLGLYFNASARCGRGNMLWAGWNASQWSDTSKCRSTSPAAGAHLVMVSTQ